MVHRPRKPAVSLQEVFDKAPSWTELDAKEKGHLELFVCLTNDQFTLEV